MSLSDLIRKKSPNPSPQVGGQYQQLIDANPYRNAQYTPSVWQDFMSLLGFRTQADAWRENMAVQAAEYDASIMQKKYDEQYNDPQSQLDRMRAAGLNPDIDGGSNISPGEAVGMPEDPSTPMQSTADSEQIQSFVGTVVSCFSTALGLVSTVQGIHRNSLSNQLLALEGDEKVSDLATKLAPTFISPYGEGNDMEPAEFLENAYQRAQLFSRRNLPKKYRDKFNYSVENFLSSAPGEKTQYKEWYDSISSQKDFYAGKSTFYSPNPQTMEKIYAHIGKAEEAIYNLSKQNEGAKLVEGTTEADYNTQVLNELDPKKEAGAKNAEFSARKNTADVTNILRGTVDDILRDLRDDSSEFSGIFSFLLRMYSLYMFTK